MDQFVHRVAPSPDTVHDLLHYTSHSISLLTPLPLPPPSAHHSLFMKEDTKEFLQPKRLKDLIVKYSQFINFPIYVWESRVRATHCTSRSHCNSFLQL